MSYSLDRSKLSNSSLCSVCQVSLPLLKKADDYQYHHLSREALTEAATKGCPICVWVWDAVSPRWQDPRPLGTDEEDWRFDVRLLHRINDDDLLYHFRTGGPKPRKLDDLGYSRGLLRVNLFVLPINGRRYPFRR